MDLFHFQIFHQSLYAAYSVQMMCSDGTRGIEKPCMGLIRVSSVANIL